MVIQAFDLVLSTTNIKTVHIKHIYILGLNRNREKKTNRTKSEVDSFMQVITILELHETESKVFALELTYSGRGGGGGVDR